ncbi:MAG: hypothetical protein IPK75_18435 [Acidobacteria bacterium]|nr:hypothetical protein [Acidobacteriota bacterium]
MPDLQNFAITKLANQTITNAPRYEISCRVTNSKTGARIRDFTGANTLTFPQVLANLSEAQRVEMIELIANWIIDKRSAA